ncbi:MAG: hypothetical protein E6H05_01180 [Bacillati bacterium ANGP1]|uniref:Histidine kinase/HSP90-like ATPase domain-containing protein n=1 Tax=Candidatus Segetimicrobium genomatis TaxID=2569760 RepID=A0A537J0Q5_9BACT|nr:MAG: hypothetical protein E6H05_01180 [Terrabacteria group bacterium ANGP1]
MDDQTKAGAGKVTKAQRSTTTEAGTSRIDLKIPGRPDYVVVVRLTAAAVAGRMGLSYDDIEDLKVAVGEACSAAILTGAPTVGVSFLIASDRLEVQITHRPAKDARSQETELNRLLMQVLMDEVDTRADGADQVTRMVKRLAR